MNTKIVFIFYPISEPLGLTDKRQLYKTEKNNRRESRSNVRHMYHRSSSSWVTSKKQDCQEYFPGHEIFFWLQVCLCSFAFLTILLRHFTTKKHDMESFMFP